MIVDPKAYADKVFAWAEQVGFKTVRLVVHQPRTGGPTEDVVPLADLEAFAADLRRAADRVRVADVDHAHAPLETWWPIYLNPDPNPEDCAYCRAMAVCPATKAKLEKNLDMDFGAIVEDGVLPPLDPYSDEALDQAMAIVPLLEDRCKAIRAEVERRLMAGREMPSFGLELGRQGNRKWADPAKAEAELRRMKIKVDDMYTLELKSPTQIEKLTKPAREEDGSVVPPKLGVRRWKMLNEGVVRGDAKPSVRPKSAIKVPWRPTPISAVEFTAVDEDDFT